MVSKLPGSGDSVMRIVWKKGQSLPKVSVQPGYLVEGWIIRSSGVVGSFIPCGKVRDGRELESLTLLPWISKDILDGTFTSSKCRSSAARLRRKVNTILGSGRESLVLGSSVCSLG